MWNRVALCAFLWRCSYSTLTLRHDAPEDKQYEHLADFVKSNLKTNGWQTILTVGHIPEEFYVHLGDTQISFVTINVDQDTLNMEGVIHYYPNFIILACQNFAVFEKSLKNAMQSPYWHPHSHFIVDYQTSGIGNHAEIFFALWYYKAINSVIIQYDKELNSFNVSHYNPHSYEHFKLAYSQGCWTIKDLGSTVTSFEKSFICVKDCTTLTYTTKINRLGTCVSYDVIAVKAGDMKNSGEFNFFMDKCRNFHGYLLRAHGLSFVPFLKISERADGGFELQHRDGLVWNTLMDTLNFSLDLSPSRKFLSQPVYFEVSIQQVYDLSVRKVDVIAFPIYIMDMIVVEVDFTFPFKDSGVCFIAPRAPYETMFLDIMNQTRNLNVILEFAVCFLSLWFGFFVFYILENHVPWDVLFGKALSNTFRSILSISVQRPPRRKLFRIITTVSIWGFFTVNFALQATIISLFTTVKRGKDIRTFEDVAATGYPIIGIATPDSALPEDDKDIFRVINSRLTPATDIYDCVDKMINDSHRICLMDCAHARFQRRNMLDEKGERYLHVPEDRIHNHYLAMVLYKHSPYTEIFSKYIMALFEGGIIEKWEEYRNNELKEDKPTKPLSTADLIAVFQLYAFMVAFSCGIFLMEILVMFASIKQRSFQ